VATAWEDKERAWVRQSFSPASSPMPVGRWVQNITAVPFLALHPDDAGPLRTGRTPALMPYPSRALTKTEAFKEPPISLLPVAAKILERVVLGRLQDLSKRRLYQPTMGPVDSMTLSRWLHTCFNTRSLGRQANSRMALRPSTYTAHSTRFGQPFCTNVSHLGSTSYAHIMSSWLTGCRFNFASMTVPWPLHTR